MVIPPGCVQYDPIYISGYITNAAIQQYLDFLLTTAREQGRIEAIAGKPDYWTISDPNILGGRRTAEVVAEVNVHLDTADHPTPAHAGWLVWNPNGRQPNYQHGSIRSAETEAQRLADTNPDQSFYVYGPLTCYRARRIIEKSKPVPVPLKTEVDLDDEIPF